MTARLARIWDLARALTLATAFAGAASAQSEGLLTIEGDLQRFLLRQHAAGHLDGPSDWAEAAPAKAIASVTARARSQIRASRAVMR
ncbi:MAG: hypothetical protein AAF594_13730, partial [Bacteroidota bacterium]